MIEPGWLVVTCRAQADGGRQRGYRHQARGPRHRVVDAARHPGVPDIGAGQHRSGQRRHGEGEAAAEHDHRGQHVGQVARVRPDPRHQGHADRAPGDTDGHRPARADPLGQPARARRQPEHQQRDRQQRCARGERREAGDDLKLQHEQEQQAAERAVHQERDHVDRGELAGGEDVERQHRHDAVGMTGAPPFDDDEGDRRRDAQQSGGQRARGVARPFRRLDQRVGYAAERKRREHRTGNVESAAAPRRPGSPARAGYRPRGPPPPAADSAGRPSASPPTGRASRRGSGRPRTRRRPGRTRRRRRGAGRRRRRWPG